MWQPNPVLIALLTALVGCGPETTDPPLDGGVVEGPAACGSATPLRAGNVRAWLDYVRCLPIARVSEVRAEIDAHRADDLIVSELLDVVEGMWKLDGTCDDLGTVNLAIAVLREMGNESGLPRAEALVWRPLPPPDTGIKVANYNTTTLETAMGTSIACIKTRAGSASAQKIIMSHPVPVVRSTTANTLEYQNCQLGP